MKIGEHGLLPAVREEAASNLIVANGFSCRQQIAHATSRHALHPAEVLQMAIEKERQLPVSPPPRRWRTAARAIPAVAAALVVAAGLSYMGASR